MTTAAHLIATAGKHVGTQEKPRGSNDQPFAKIAGHANGQPWCATFVVATAKEAGLHLPDGATSAYCPTDEAAYKRAGRLDTHPTVGAQFFVYFTTMGRVAHTGWVSAVTGGNVHTIEGNTNTDGSRDGYEVARRVRPIGRAPGRTGIRSYGHPVYTAALVSITHTLKQGQVSAQVKAMQHRLVQLKYLPAGGDDGAFGPKTATAVRKFKAARKYAHMDHNAEVGGGTVAALGGNLRWKG